jgi:hypothetical protein
MNDNIPVGIGYELGLRLIDGFSLMSYAAVVEPYCASGGASRTFAELRRLAAGGTVIAGVSAGPYVLAQAGLLKGYRTTNHWEHRAAFIEDFPTHALESKLLVIDRRRISCGGGLREKYGVSNDRVLRPAGIERPGPP